MAGEIVLGYDASEGARAALPQAVDLAAAFGVPLLIAFAYGANPVGGVTGDIERATSKVGEGFLNEAVATAQGLNPAVTVEAELVNGLPVDALVALAKLREARILVVGGNGRGPLVGTLLGSVSYKLLHQTKVPVLVVQPDED